MTKEELIYEFIQECELLALEFNWRVCIYRQPSGCGWNVYFRRTTGNDDKPYEYYMPSSAIFFDKHPEELKKIIQDARKVFEEYKRKDMM